MFPAFEISVGLNPCASEIHEKQSRRSVIKKTCHPERNLSREAGQMESKDP